MSNQDSHFSAEEVFEMAHLSWAAMGLYAYIFGCLDHQAQGRTGAQVDLNHPETLDAAIELIENGLLQTGGGYLSCKPKPRPISLPVEVEE